MNTNRAGLFWFAIGSILAALSVVMGAFGAHGLESTIHEVSDDPAKSIGQWETASRYQMYHSIGIILVGICFATFGKRTEFTVAGVAFLFGILVFSGLLYILVLTQVKILGAIVPLGGLAMIFGWTALAVAAIRIQSTNPPGNQHDE